MRCDWLMLCAGLLLAAGCAHSEPRSRTSAGKPAVGKTSVKKPVRPSPSDAAQTPRVTPVYELTGKIAATNPQLRFVVIDFSLSQLPETEQRFSVYRQGQKVGEVKISGPARDYNIAADLVAGEAKVGDEVRP